ncbi:DEAD/DEAH box helicase [Geodermatophilus sp. DSM 45219]|uniref:DEAD/DEAH box helicase n=1 Tax=Geodermatophilus sp. DSM 45219 TaxID=1881103 RepID=UPI00088DD698|nr:DEAD/DEAH box helicase [Geodermatophilus sp. DSM 45219]SDN83112.1 Helicase conserved C-terminal domain-containing protein [Geodermatophilus sp. DSM 45219]
MAEYLDAAGARARLRDTAPILDDAFDLLRFVAHGRQLSSLAEADAVDLAVRLHARRSEFTEYVELLDGLLREVGLYPYLFRDDLGARDLIALEAHRPIGASDLVLHRVQAEIYRAIMQGENLMVSAPTSFGKSALIDAVLASGRYVNVAIIVPTLALIDETRRRLHDLNLGYKVLTHQTQIWGQKNVLVVTQERLLDLDGLPALDFFVIDEFYKLDTRQDEERGTLLNSALQRLLRTDAQFLLLGPAVQSISPDIPGTFSARFVHTDFKTVAADVERIRVPEASKREALVELLDNLTGPSLVYCRSPRRVRDVCLWQLTNRSGDDVDGSVLEAADWLERNFHPDWYVPAALRRGIGVHHARLPRSISQWMVRAFNDGQLAQLVCTSTLIEGVNTRAKNVVILDNRIGQAAYDYFTFNNISGRSGRMFQHFVGRVVMFHDPPDPELPVVDIPVLTQSDNANTSLLLQLPEDELTSSSRQRLGDVVGQDLIAPSLLADNVGVEPENQLAFARRVAADRGLATQLAWTGEPTYDELRVLGQLILDSLKRQKGRVAGVSSGAQLAFFISRLRSAGGDLDELVLQRLGQEAVDDAVENTLEFLRYWPGHNLPRFLRVADSLQKAVLPRLGIRPGDYTYFAGRCEDLFLPRYFSNLEEYGIPAQLVLKLDGLLSPASSLDDLLSQLSALDSEVLPLDSFERGLFLNARSYFA